MHVSLCGQDRADDGGVPAEPQPKPAADQGPDRADSQGPPGRHQGAQIAIFPAPLNPQQVQCSLSSLSKRAAAVTVVQIRRRMLLWQCLLQALWISRGLTGFMILGAAVSRCCGCPKACTATTTPTATWTTWPASRARASSCCPGPTTPQIPRCLCQPRSSQPQLQEKLEETSCFTPCALAPFLERYGNLQTCGVLATGCQ